MKRSKLRLSPLTEFSVYLVFGLLLVTGVVWMWAQSGLDDGSHVSSLMLKLHGAAAMVALILLGALINHMRKGWKARKNHPSGLTLMLVILFLVITGYGLYYAGDEQLRSLISQWHAWIGLALFLLLPVHALIGRAIRRKQSAGNAGLPDDLSAIALAKPETSGVSNDGRSRGTPVLPASLGMAESPSPPAVAATVQPTAVACWAEKLERSD
jgi:hypothetical protein